MLGYVLLSKQIELRLSVDWKFGEFLGRSIHEHMATCMTAKPVMGGDCKTSYQFGRFFFWIITSRDDNDMPRTAVVTPTEGGT
jgi:hypothetical protein